MNEFSPVMGLDLSLTSTGVCVIRDPEHWMTWVIKPKIPKNATEEDRIKRLLYISEEIYRIFKQEQVKDIVMEGYAFGSIFGREKMGELGGIIKYVFYDKDKVVVKSYPVRTLRSHLFNKGGFTKDQVKKSLSKYNKLSFNTEDEMDSFVVAAYLFDLVNRAGYFRKKLGGSLV